MFSFRPKKNTQRIYVDFAATTPVSKRVLRAMRPFWSDIFGNPSSIHKEGVQAKEAIEDARKQVARVLAVKARDIFFTAGGTESVNLALLGVVQKALQENTTKGKPQVLISAIEHAAVHRVAEEIQRLGGTVTVIPVSEEGMVNPQDIADALTEDTVLVSVMYANNEIGTIQPLKKIARVISAFKQKHDREETAYPYFHSDAAQAPNYLSVQAEKLGVDVLSLDSSKMYGPKGVGILYKKPFIELHPLHFGGKQEDGLRAGTENVAGIVGCATALVEADALRDKETARLQALQTFFIEAMQAQMPSVMLNGSREHRLPNNVHLCFEGLRAEYGVLQLDAKRIACTATTACKSNEESGDSYVVRALGKDTCASSSIRFTFGRTTTKKQLEYVIETIVATFS